MDYTSELKKLHELKEKNVISEDEFNDQKESILSKMKREENKQQKVSTSTLTADPDAKSKMIAGLLGVFLGGFGVHRFYLGYIGIGVAQLCVTLITCGFGALWGFIEGILILTGSTITVDADGKSLVE
jgi:TM2 domain-containing membrane protein YozV